MITTRQIVTAWFELLWCQLFPKRHPKRLQVMAWYYTRKHRCSVAGLPVEVLTKLHRTSPASIGKYEVPFALNQLCRFFDQAVFDTGLGYALNNVFDHRTEFNVYFTDVEKVFTAETTAQVRQLVYEALLNNRDVIPTRLHNLLPERQARLPRWLRADVFELVPSSPAP
jgi:hypothetical protein